MRQRAWAAFQFCAALPVVMREKGPEKGSIDAADCAMISKCQWIMRLSAAAHKRKILSSQSSSATRMLLKLPNLVHRPLSFHTLTR